MLSVLLLLVIPGICAYHRVRPHINNFRNETTTAITNLIATAVDTIRATEVDLERLEDIRVNNRNSPAYEMGFLMKTLQENYRKQLEKFILVKHMNTRLYVAELIIFLMEIEHHYWETEHICNMIHEIERKWGIKDNIDMSESVKKIFSELSWASKAKVIQKYYPPKDSRNLTSNNLMFPSSITFKLRPGGHPIRKANRRFQIEAQKLPERPVSNQPAFDAPTSMPDAMVPTDDDKSMKLKLFRLMYEMIRDSDLKVVRAEQIRTHYTNSTSFDIGYLLGDVNDKFNVMTDIRNTVRRLYADWRPIEHINAYEQIANQAIEINHLIDMVNTISKKT